VVELKLTERKRAAILAAAREEFLTQGFRETSMDRVAERAEVSKRTVYNHFASKEDLFYAITAGLVEEMHQAVRTPYSPDKALEDQLREIAQREIDLVTSESYLATFKVLLVESFTVPGVTEAVLASIPQDQDPMKQWIGAAVDDGRLSVDDVTIAGKHFYSLIKGAFFWPIIVGYGRVPRGKERETLITSSIEMFLDHYRAN